MKQLARRLSSAIGVIIGIVFAVPVRAAAAMNPNTGDPTSRIMGWVFIALGVSLIVIIILFFILGKNRRD